MVKRSFLGNQEGGSPPARQAGVKGKGNSGRLQSEGEKDGVQTQPFIPQALSKYPFHVRPGAADLGRQLPDPASRLPLGHLLEAELCLWAAPPSYGWGGRAVNN